VSYETALVYCGPHWHSETEKMAEACSYIVENCALPLTLEDIALRTGFSKFHFSRMFRKYTNMLLSDFIADVRIRKVEQLLADDGAKICDIALEAGFGSLSAFNKAFKKNKGISPSEFRNMHE
jgi:AraC-like DNA-binding protein